MDFSQDVWSLLSSSSVEDCYTKLNDITPEDCAVVFSKFMSKLQKMRKKKPKPFSFWMNSSTSPEHNMWLKFLDTIVYTLHAENRTSDLYEKRRLYSLRLIKKSIIFEYEIRSISSPSDSSFPLGYYQVILASILQTPNFSQTYLKSFCKEFLQQFTDLRFYTLTAIRKILDEATSDSHPNTFTSFNSLAGCNIPWFTWRLRDEDLRERLFDLLSQLPPPVKKPATNKDQKNDEDENSEDESDDDESEVGSDINEMDEVTEESQYFLNLSNKGKASNPYYYRQLFQNVWLLFLRKTPQDVNNLESLTYYLPQKVFPHITNPLNFSEFLLELYSTDGPISVKIAALCGIFYLLTRTRIGDPDSISTAHHFYRQLYKLIQPITFSLAQTARFQRLLVASLNSPLLPSHLVCMFVKKCSRTACLVSPPSALWLIAFVCNLVRKYNHICLPLLNAPKHFTHNLKVKYDPFDYLALDIFGQNNSENVLPIVSSSNSPVTEKALPQLGNGSSDTNILYPEKESPDSNSPHLSNNSNLLSDILDIDMNEFLPNSLKATIEDLSPSLKQQLKMSLWELQILKHHFLPSLSNISRFIEIDTLKPSAKKIDINDFTDIRYSTLMKNTIKRRLPVFDPAKPNKRVPVVAQPNPTPQTSKELLHLSTIF